MDDWLGNLATLMRWSPYASEVELLKQVSKMGGSASSTFLSLLLESFSTDFWIGVFPLVSSSAIFCLEKSHQRTGEILGFNSLLFSCCFYFSILLMLFYLRLAVKAIYSNVFFMLGVLYFFQFNDIGWHGTKVIVFNLWLNDDGILELDFDSDEHVTQLFTPWTFQICSGFLGTNPFDYSLLSQYLADHIWVFSSFFAELEIWVLEIEIRVKNWSSWDWN